MLSSLDQVTAVPTGTVMDPGWKLKPAIETAFPDAADGAAAGALAAAGADVVVEAAGARGDRQDGEDRQGGETDVRCIGGLQSLVVDGSVAHLAVRLAARTGLGDATRAEAVQNAGAP